MSIPFQRAKLLLISSYVSKSASRSAPRVSSENTTPQPKVASGGLRSITVIWSDGFAFFASRAKYRPAGPPPTTTAFIRSAHDVRQLVDLVGRGQRGKQDQLIAPGVAIAAQEIDHRVGRREIGRRHLFRKRPGEGVIVAQVVRARFCGAGAECEIGHPPKDRGPRA